MLIALPHPLSRLKEQTGFVLLYYPFCCCRPWFGLKKGSHVTGMVAHAFILSYLGARGKDLSVCAATMTEKNPVGGGGSVCVVPLLPLLCLLLFSRDLISSN